MSSVKFSVAMLLAPISLGLLALTGCSTAPPTQQGQADLSTQTHAAFADMLNTDPSLNDLVQKSYAYAVFPSIGSGGAGIAGAYGRGEVFQGGKFIGYADMSQGTIGPQLGGETYSELIVFEDQQALNNFEANKLAFAAGASAVALKAGAATNADFENGVAVFTKMTGGLMAAAAIGGQQFSFETPDTAQQPQQ